MRQARIEAGERRKFLASLMREAQGNRFSVALETAGFASSPARRRSLFIFAALHRNTEFFLSKVGQGITLCETGMREYLFMIHELLTEDRRRFFRASNDADGNLIALTGRPCIAQAWMEHGRCVLEGVALQRDELFERRADLYI